MLDSRRIHRRTFLTDLGRGAVAMAVVSVAARPVAAQSPSPGASPALSPAPGGSPGASMSLGAVAWERVLQVVSESARSAPDVGIAVWSGAVIGSVPVHL